MSRACDHVWETFLKMMQFNKHKHNIILNVKLFSCIGCKLRQLYMC